MQPPAPFFSTLTSRTKTWIVSAAGFYRLIEQDRAFLDGMAGLRYWSVDSSLKLGAGILPARESSNREDWMDPIIGLKGLVPLGASKIFVSGALVLGGFGVGSDFMWDGLLNLGYQWTPCSPQPSDTATWTSIMTKMISCTMFIRTDSFWDSHGAFREIETCGKTHLSENSGTEFSWDYCYHCSSP
jgi:hypothetical protein